MLSESPEQDELTASRGRYGIKFLAVISALVISAVLLTGYAILRKRHAARTAASAVQEKVEPAGPKGPAKVHILVDDPLLQSGNTVLGGTVKNISQEELTGLTVQLELRRRKDGSIEEKSLPLEPASLAPDQEGKYSARFPSQQYASMRLAGIKLNDSTLLAYSSGPGQKRPLEKTESKTVVVQRPGSSRDEFINTPDNPGRIP